MENTTAIALIAAGAHVSRESIGHFLGPSAKYLGEEGLQAAKACVENVRRIVSIAMRKSNCSEDGGVNPRVLKHVFDEGRFIEDSFSAEYFGGLLASSRTADGRDDTAIPMVALVKSMSADQIRLHYVIYACISKHLQESDDLPGTFLAASELRIPHQQLAMAMAVKPLDADSRMPLALAGLADSGLVKLGVEYEARSVRVREVPPAYDAIVVRPTERGCRLFLRALGARGADPQALSLFVPATSLSTEVRSISLPQDSSLLKRELPADKLNEVESELTDSLMDAQSSIEELSSRVDALEQAAAEDDDDSAE